MTLADIIAIAVILLIVGGAAAYIIIAKKKGQKCIGCPDSKTCGSSKSGGCNGSCSGCNGSCHNASKKQKHITKACPFRGEP